MSEQVVEVLRAHLPRDRYDDDGASVGTYCTCGGWEGDYFTDGEAGPFDAHLAETLEPLIAERERVAAERALRGAADAFGHMWQADDVPAPVVYRALRQRATDLSAQSREGEETR